MNSRKRVFLFDKIIKFDYNNYMNIKEIVKKLELASEIYYNSGDTIMSDLEFDNLVDELRKKDPDNDFFKKIGASATGKKIKHLIPMGSQEKLNSKEEFDKWAKKISDLCNKNKYNKNIFVLQYKVDGTSNAFNYKNGNLNSIVSRGDGVEGDDISFCGKMFKGVPHNIKKFNGSIRGEAVIDNDVFEKNIKNLGYKNPRNAASGISRDFKDNTLAKNIHVIFYDLHNEEKKYETEEQRLEALIELVGKDNVVPYFFFNSSEDLWKKFQEINNSRDSIPYDIDGVVVRCNYLSVQEEMGFSTDLRPHGQKCIKCSQKAYQTILRGVTVSIGSQGNIVPTAYFDPIEINGTTVSNALLNNYDLILELDLAIGDTVLVQKMGDIIPKIIKKVKNAENRIPIVVPETCFCCNSKLIKDGAHSFCRNEDCEGSAISRLQKYIYKRNIKWFGEELVEELYNNHNIKDVSDLYNINKKQLENVKRGIGVVGVAAEKIIEEIEKSKTCSVSELLGSLSIPLLGRRMCEIIQKQNNKELTIEDYLNFTVNDLLKLEGFQLTKSQKIIEGIKKNKELIVKLSKIITINKIAKKEVVSGGLLENKCFCFTGAINKIDENGVRFTRKMMSELVIKNNGEVLDDIKIIPNKEVYLVQADPSSESSKSKKANKLGVKIISEEDFFKMV